jgi:DNA replication protein DnaC
MAKLRAAAEQALPRTMREIGVPALVVGARPGDLAPALWAAMQSCRGDLVLHGPTGTGKTYAAAALVSWFLTQELIHPRDMAWRPVAALVDELTALGSGARALAELVAVRVLIVDDWGLQRETPFVAERLDGLLVGRHDSARQTIITTNLQPTELMRRSARIGSRLLSGTVLRLAGVDRRLARPKAGRV